jgi:hypothetical protein
MIYLYVLASNEDDLFLEQLLVSITSLRLKTPNATVMVITDETTASTLTGKRATLHTIAEIKTLNLPLELNNLLRSRWLKTTMRQHIKGDFLYIDCDTIISADLSDVNNLDANLGAVPDQHTHVKEHQLKKRFYDLDKILGFSSAVTTNIHFNSGVLLCRDMPAVHNFFKEWHKLWLYSIYKNIEVDQPSFNQANVNSKSIITELNGKWNCQIEFSGLQYLSEAKIIHYFTSNRNRKPFIPANDSFLKNIKETGQVSPEIKEQLTNPLKLFDPNIRIVSDKRMLNIIDSSLFDYIFIKTFDKNDNSTLLNSISNFISATRSLKGNFARIFNKSKSKR